MGKKPIITTMQLLMMAVGSALVFPFTFMPSVNTEPKNQDVWIVLLLSFVFILVLNAPVLFLINKFRGMDVNEMAEASLGKFFGKAALIPIALFCIYCFVACMEITVIFIDIYLFTKTPTWALLACMAIPASYAAFKGAGTIGRLAVFIVPVMLFMTVLFFILGIKDMNIDELRPALVDSSFLKLVQGAFYTAARYSEILILLVFSYFLGNKASINKTYAASLGVYGVSKFLIVLPTMLVLGVDLAQHALNPYWVFTRQVDMFGYMERVQALNLVAWFPGAILKLTIYNYMASYIFAGIINKAKSRRYFSLSFSFAGFVVCLLPFVNKSSTIAILRSDKVFPWMILPTIVLIPLIIVVVYLIRKKKIDQLIKCRQNS